jgi:hypothetical protein
MKRFVILFALLILVPFAVASGKTKNDSYKVESIGELKEAKVAEAVRAALDPKGLRVVNDKGKTVCEIWFGKSIPADNKEEIAGANFPQIAEGTFIGVINFPASASDFRGQEIKANFYTLRFGLILQDGNHLGVSPARDFFLLCPITEDKDPNTRLKPEELIRLSRRASGTGHPSVWSLTTATSDKDLPRIVKNEHEHVILETQLPTKSGPLAVGLIVIGKTEG